MRILRACFYSGLIVVSMSVTAFGKDHVSPNRSIYLPVAVRVCNHLEANARYYENDELVGTTPLERTVQFTYYPALKRVLPAAIQIRVEGVYLDTKKPFVGRFALTPKGIYTANTHQPLDLIAALRKSHRQIDVHLKPLVLQIACDRLCPRAKTVVPGSARSEEHQDSQPEPETEDASPDSF